MIMGIGGVLVAALVVWALTRTVEPASVMTDADAPPVASGTTSAPPTTNTGFPPLSTATAGGTAGMTATTATNISADPTPPQRPPEVQGDRGEVRRIAVEDLKAQVDRNAVTVVDVRDAASFARGHIPGAINIPFASVEAQLDQIPKGKPIVTYCT